MAEKMASSRHGGKYCAAGHSKQTSCTNSQFTKGISMHEFPNEERYPKIRREWVSFVRKHRPNFAPSRKSYLCSAHFDSSVFTLNLDVAASLGMKRKLKSNAVPTIDVAGISEPSTSKENIYDRKRRQIIRESKRIRPKKPNLVAVDKDSCEESEDESETLTASSCHVEMQSTSSDTDTKDVTCNNCEALKRKVIQLQKRISWLKKSKAEKLQTRRQEDTRSESSEREIPLAGRHAAYRDSDSESSDEETIHQKGDGDWSTHEEDSQSTTDDDAGNDESSPLQFDPQTKPHAEPKFIVFYGMIMSLFSMFCFNCKSASPKVEITRNGSLATVTQICKACPPNRWFQWRSQPFVLG